ncbi:hypothetical protein HMPREF1544_10528 [Mucor circinelloides 1006PhL]|uniref:Uncharacterized protein n=1 Tax=Mucor circinelloides f. circinelloides (strain 1006PhL) TaxID=1220926 RepID=S2JSC8_MUCC1|nr:hypothetical protein HMPREF1544_10528 [Mucor circinelloides 1006PhL]
MSRLNEISTQAFADDENSNMDENLETYQSASTARQRQTHSLEDQCQPSPITLHSGLISPNNATGSATLRQRVLIIEDDTSGAESIGSFHTAPSTPTCITMDQDEDADVDRQKTTIIVDELLKEEKRLMQKLEFEDKEIQRIACEVEAKRAKLNALELKKLEYYIH